MKKIPVKQFKRDCKTMSFISVSKKYGISINTVNRLRLRTTSEKYFILNDTRKDISKNINHIWEIDIKIYSTAKDVARTMKYKSNSPLDIEDILDYCINSLYNMKEETFLSLKENNKLYIKKIVGLCWQYIMETKEVHLDDWDVVEDKNENPDF